MWSFCLRSVAREYGWHFAWRIAARRPLRTMKALGGSGFAKVVVIAVASAAVEAASPHAWDNFTMQLVPSALAWTWLA